MKHEAFFSKHPVFTGEEMADYLSSYGEVGSRTKEALLAYYRDIDIRDIGTSMISFVKGEM